MRKKKKKLAIFVMIQYKTFYRKYICIKKFYSIQWFWKVINISFYHSKLAEDYATPPHPPAPKKNKKTK